MVVKATAGSRRARTVLSGVLGGRCSLRSGVPTSLWLTGDSAWLALPGRAAQFELEHAPDLAGLLDQLLAEGTVTVCAQCAARRGIDGSDLIAGVRLAGAATFVAEVMVDGAQALVY